MSELAPISPAELVYDILTRLSWPDLAPGGVVVGPANDTQQQAGVVQVTQAGLPNVEKYVPVTWMRAQIRCLAGTIDEADTIAGNVQNSLHGKVRVLARMRSTDERYLVHLINVIAGPSAHYDSPETAEYLLFAELMLSTDPIQYS